MQVSVRMLIKVDKTR